VSGARAVRAGFGWAGLPRAGRFRARGPAVGARAGFWRAGRLRLRGPALSGSEMRAVAAPLPPAGAEPPAATAGSARPPADPAAAAAARTPVRWPAGGKGNSSPGRGRPRSPPSESPPPAGGGELSRSGGDGTATAQSSRWAQRWAARLSRWTQPLAPRSFSVGGRAGRDQPIGWGLARFGAVARRGARRRAQMKDCAQ
jgi:hypothetical protein